MAISIDMSPMATLAKWGNILTSPLGIIMIIGIAIYVFLRISGKIGGLGGMFNKGNKGNNNQSRRPDYIIK